MLTVSKSVSRPLSEKVVRHLSIGLPNIDMMSVAYPNINVRDNIAQWRYLGYLLCGYQSRSGDYSNILFSYTGRFSHNV